MPLDNDIITFTSTLILLLLHWVTLALQELSTCKLAAVDYLSVVNFSITIMVHSMKYLAQLWPNSIQILGKITL